ncbi:AAA family ATPase [Microbacterium paraoxydans]|uniref:AAA family ATPase n=1 Tax=Microbacterium paraoxydans TaxID=199592 RepID=UPI001CFAA279|nr:AAA family ATPase [Microbacterium paraoxydans]
MRIVVSGTHASGKSTLIADFRSAHPEYLSFGDPFDDLEDLVGDPAGEASFVGQLRIADARLRAAARQPDVIAERGPLDFAAYLMALERLGRSTGALLPRAIEIAEDSLAHVELVVLVPLDERRSIPVPDEEDPALREAMDQALLDLADDLEHDARARFLTVAGDGATRLATLVAAIAE